jgi:ATP/maltotriose-dependent transcriptional regulator MalT
LQQLAVELRDVDAARWPPLVHLLRTAIAFYSDVPGLAEDFTEEAYGSSDPWARASARMFQAAMSENDGDLEGMRSNGARALAEFRAIGERWGITNSLRIAAQLAVLDGDLHAGLELYEEAVELTSQLDSHEDEGFLLGRLADIELRRGDLERARHYIERARSQAEESASPLEAVFALALLGGVERMAGDPAAARQWQAAAMDRLAELPPAHPASGHLRAMLLGMAIHHHIADDELDAATSLVADTVTTAINTHDSPVLATVGVAVAELRLANGDAVGAAQMLGASARIRGGDDWTAVDIASLRRALIEHLGAGPFARAFERGKALDREAAIERLSTDLPS